MILPTIARSRSGLMGNSIQQTRDLILGSSGTAGVNKDRGVAMWKGMYDDMEEHNVCDDNGFSCWVYFCLGHFSIVMFSCAFKYCKISLDCGLLIRFPKVMDVI
jgi:hypothetical protein